MTSLSADVSKNSASPKSTHPLLWSVRREIWEHRMTWIAPISTACVVLAGFLLGIIRLQTLLNVATKLPPMSRAATIAAPFTFAALPIMATGVVLSIFFCLSALSNERRDRSILFWKSLPVSDTQVVLAKALVPLLVVPLIVLGTLIVAQLAMLLIGTVALFVVGTGVPTLWMGWPIAQFELTLLYLMITGVLWYAPIYAWCLMVSSWARRAVFLWAVLPWFGLFIIEKLALGTDYIGSLIDYRLYGVLHLDFNFPHFPQHANIKLIPVINPLNDITPERFFLSPGLWLGLAATVAFLAAAVWFRRTRDPG